MPSKLYQTLKVLFAKPIVILMLGEWQSGKTDTSFLMAHLAKKWKLIDKIGSNTWTFNNPNVDFIIAMNRLRNWLHMDRSRKLFIFDEGLKHAYRRKAMSTMNVDIITEILPELSKGKGRMIFCSQIEKLDTDIIHPAFCRAIWRKRTKKVMYCVSKHHPPRTFRNLPRSPIRFDPYRVAPFLHTDMSKKANLGKGDEIYEVAKRYAENQSVTKIKKDMNLHQEKVKRDIRKALGRFIEYEDRAREGKENLSESEKPLDTENAEENP